MQPKQVAVHCMTCLQDPIVPPQKQSNFTCMQMLQFVYTVVCVTYVYQNESSLVAAAAAAQVLLSLHVLLAPSVPVDTCVV